MALGQLVGQTRPTGWPCIPDLEWVPLELCYTALEPPMQGCAAHMATAVSGHKLEQPLGAVHGAIPCAQQAACGSLRDPQPAPVPDCYSSTNWIEPMDHVFDMFVVQS